MAAKAFIFGTVIAIPALLSGQQNAPVGIEASIASPLSDGTPAAPRPPREKPNFQVEATQVRLMEVVEPPPMAGLPPVEGTVTLTVHSVADPGLPDPPRPVPPVPVDPKVREQLAELRLRHAETNIAFVSATVYDRSRTLLTCYPNGGADKVVKAWSNLDFNHFSGFGTFEAKGSDGEVRRYALLMGIGNKDGGARAALLASKGVDYEVPQIPAIPDGQPAFVVLTENPDPQSLVLIEDLHALYRAEGERMAAACAAREKAYQERKAYLLANPPKPKDVTVHFWKREQAEPSLASEGGEP